MKKFFDYIFSMQFAGMLLLVFAAAIGTATFIENDHGTLAAKSIVYEATWFELLLVLTGISLIGSVFKYKLYERKKYSVLFFHLAFVVMLMGAGITRYFGYEGTMMIREGESSNQIISENPFVQVEISKDGDIFSFNKEYLFTPYKKNRFRDHFIFGNEEATLKFRQYLPNAGETIEEHPNGIPIISFVTVEKGNRKNVFIKSGDSFMSGMVLFRFNQDVTDSSSVMITINDAGGLEFTAPFETVVVNMMANTSDTLAAFEAHPLNLMQLYSFGSSQVVIRAFLPKARTKLVATPGSGGNGVGAILFDLTYHGKTEEIAVMGDKGMIGRPVTTSIDGTDFSVAYGSMYIQIPFYIYLRDFQLERYPGSMSPSSFASEVTVIDPQKNLEMDFRIFMNNILNYGGFRFFQSSYDKDELGTILSVNHDKWGTIITYLGYFILAAGLVFNFFSRNSRFQKLARASSNLSKPAAALALALMTTTGLWAQHGNMESMNYDPQKISAAHAREFGKLLVQDKDGRMKPINTLSSEVLRKIYRKDKMMGMSSDQVFLGMVSNPVYWQTVPMIKVSDKQLKQLLGVSGSYASFNDFLDMQRGQYKLSRHIDEAYNKKPAERSTFDKDVIKVDERVNLVYAVYTGDFLNLFPEPGHPNSKWHTYENAYDNFDSTNAGFVSNIIPVYFGAVNDAMQSGDWSLADENLGYISLFQERNGSEIMPPSSKTKAEMLYNEVNIFKRLFPFYGTIGLIFIIVLFISLLNPKVNFKWIIRILGWVILIAFIFHTIGLAMRWYISGHAPWSNGYETMIYIAWGTVLSGLLFSKKSKITLATTAILASVTLMVANLSWLDPEITPLVPVLKSYWLVIHVAIITASYSFLGVGALLGFLNMVLIASQRRSNFERLNPTIQELTNINEMNLIIGVFLVTIGTFLGAVWANESWGRYWGWDPKETWALVTVLVYSFIVHMRLIPGLSGVFAFNFAALIGFSSVLMTYFGVNYYLSGLHSYASGDPVPVPTFVYYTVAIVFIVSLASYINHIKLKKENVKE